MFEELAGKNVALFWSGGMDSTLLLAMLRESSPVEFSIVQFREYWTREQAKRVDARIRDWNLKVFSYPAKRVSFIGNDDEISAVFEVTVGNDVMPVVADLIEGDRCILTLAEMTMPTAPFQFDIAVVGSRKDDSHWSLNSSPVPAEKWEQNGMKFYAPLYEWSREDVKRELRTRGLDDTEADEQSDTGNISLCDRCVKGTGEVFCPRENKFIPSVAWDRKANLSNFQQAYS